MKSVKFRVYSREGTRIVSGRVDETLFTNAKPTDTITVYEDRFEKEKQCILSIPHWMLIEALENYRVEHKTSS